MVVEEDPDREMDLITEYLLGGKRKANEKKGKNRDGTGSRPSTGVKRY